MSARLAMNAAVEKRSCKGMPASCPFLWHLFLCWPVVARHAHSPLPIRELLGTKLVANRGSEAVFLQSTVQCIVYFLSQLARMRSTCNLRHRLFCAKHLMVSTAPPLLLIACTFSPIWFVDGWSCCVSEPF